MKTERIITWVTVAVSLIVSIVALCRSLPCMVGMDYMGVIVGILSLLITMLIGWNIYTVVDFNRRKEDLVKQEQILKTLVAQVDNNTTGHAAAAEYSFASIYLYLITGSEPLGLEYWYINHTLYTILRYSEIGGIKECNAFIDMLLTTITNPSKIKVSKERITEFLQILNLVRDKDKIEKYTELMRLVSSLGSSVQSTI